MNRSSSALFSKPLPTLLLVRPSVGKCSVSPLGLLDGFFTIAFIFGCFGADVRSCRSLLVVKFDLDEAVPWLERRDPFLDGNILVLTGLQGET